MSTGPSGPQSWAAGQAPANSSPARGEEMQHTGGKKEGTCGWWVGRAMQGCASPDSQLCFRSSKVTSLQQARENRNLSSWFYLEKKIKQINLVFLKQKSFSASYASESSRKRTH